MRFIQFIIIISLGLILLGCGQPKSQVQSHSLTGNNLKNETSPYLLQHANNPVDWFPWGEEALEKAKAENKLIVVSVGYAACHWCHVMEHESFEDSIVAAQMNQHFVSIKVDREERPDIDQIYMDACQLASRGGCGWPLNAFALPDGRPFWAGTYFPKEQWLDILNRFQKMWEEEPESLENFASELTKGVQQNPILELDAEEINLKPELLKGLVEKYYTSIDFKWGGFKGAPKFPIPGNYQFLLNYYFHQKDPKALETVETTLKNMADGGIYDHLRGGFARYSTDDKWVVPHFEKMLYDNGQLVSLYSQAYKLTENAHYKKVVKETLEFIQSELTAPNGAFYSSLDADSEGEEGQFYIWTMEELEDIISDKKELEAYADFYELRKNGNWEKEKNILYRRKSLNAVAEKHNIPLEELENLISKTNEKLLKARNKRERPGTDDKILTAWNALMIKGYVDAYQAFQEPEYLKTAKKAAEFIRDNMRREDKGLWRNHKEGQWNINGFLDDYAYTIDAFVALYQATFNEEWLNIAKDLLDYAQEYFSDEDSVMLHYVSSLDPPLVARKIELTDNVIPSSNAAMAHNFYNLGLYFYEDKYLDRAKSMLEQLQNPLFEQEQPRFFYHWALLFLRMAYPTYEVAIVGEDFEKKRAALNQVYQPNALFMGGAEEGKLQLLEDKLSEGETLIYVCRNKVCKLPVSEPEAALPLMPSNE